MAFSSRSSRSPGNSLVTECNKLRGNCTQGSSPPVQSPARLLELQRKSEWVSELLPPTPPLLQHKPAERKLKPDPIQAAPAKAGLSFLSLSLSPSLYFLFPSSFFCVSPQPLQPAGVKALGFFFLLLLLQPGRCGAGGAPGLCPPPAAGAPGHGVADPPPGSLRGSPSQVSRSLSLPSPPPRYYSRRQRVSLPSAPAQRWDTPRSDSPPSIPPPGSHLPGGRPLPSRAGFPSLRPGSARGEGRSTATHGPGHACHAVACTSLPPRCPARRWRSRLCRTGSPKRTAKLKSASRCSRSPKCIEVQSMLVLQRCESTGLARKPCQILCPSLESPPPWYRTCPATNAVLLLNMTLPSATVPLAPWETYFVFNFSVSLAWAHIHLLWNTQVLQTTPACSQALTSPCCSAKTPRFRKRKVNRDTERKIRRPGINAGLLFSLLPAKDLVQRSPWGACVPQWSSYKPFSFP